MPKGGRRRGAGRKKGIPNKATAELNSLAGMYGPAAMKELIRLATKAESDMVRVSAIREILDRGFGKAAQPLTGANGEGPVQYDNVEFAVVDGACRGAV